MKIGFLFNHDAGHQAGHLAPILNAFAAARPGDELTAFVGGAALKESLRHSLSSPNVEIVELSLHPLIGVTARVLDVAMPASRWSRLAFNVDKFRHLDALVAPERTSLTIQKALKREQVSFIYSGHGAGDRAIGFHPSFSRFDLLLLPGEKYVRRLRQTGGLSGNEHELIGYPKFDFVRRLDGAPHRFFDNPNPTVVYNPHFSPEYSSWFKSGVAVLEWFAENPGYNLIVAPHVMLFRRRLHISTDSGRIAWRPEVPEQFRRCKNILIDTDSPRLFDMSYMLSSDIYLGDVSSQVMEFLVRPRPCIFLNTNQHNWRDDPNFAFWRLGPVIERAEGLDAVLRDAQAEPEKYRDLQSEHFADSFSLTDETSSIRAVHAIGNFLERRRATVRDSAPASTGVHYTEQTGQTF